MQRIRLIPSDHQPSLPTIEEPIAFFEISTVISDMCGDFAGDDAGAVSDETFQCNVPGITHENLSLVHQYIARYWAHQAGADPGEPYTKCVHAYLEKTTREERAEKNAKEVVNVESWERPFFSSIEMRPLWSLYAAANYLGIRRLFDGCRFCIADRIRGRDEEEICRLFELNQPLTDEDRKRAIERSPWLNVE